MTQADWLSCVHPEPLLREVQTTASSRKVRLFAVACCRRIWQRLVDNRSRQAVELLELHIEGLASDEQLQNAVSEAKAAYRALREQVMSSFVGPDLARRAIEMPRGLFDLTDNHTASEAHDAADNDPITLAACAVWSATSSVFNIAGVDYTLADCAIGTADYAAAIPGQLESEQSAQADLVRDILGTPFSPTLFAPTCLTPEVVALAQAAYDKRLMPEGYFSEAQLGILGDALEEAGCTDSHMLAHCREPGPHVRGCWVVDLVLGKK